MKFTLRMVVLLLLSVQVAYGQSFGNLSQEQMQQMMQGAMEMQACLAQVDQAELNRLAEEAKGIESELKALCANQKRAEAQQKAMEYGLKFKNSPTMKQLMDCGEMANAMIPQVMAYMETHSADSETSTTSPIPHVCDHL